jgi:hypothetical protein
MSRMTVRFDRVFDKKGNFNITEFNLTWFDPYRRDDNNKNHVELFELLFDKDGHVLEEVQSELATYIKIKKFGALTDAAKLYYAGIHGRNTNNAYPAVYMFR